MTDDITKRDDKRLIDELLDSKSIHHKIRPPCTCARCRAAKRIKQLKMQLHEADEDMRFEYGC